MSALMLSAIRSYDQLGWSLLPIPFGEKKTTERDWPTAPDDIPLLEALAGGRMNLAVRLGPRSGYLADVDLDSEGAVKVAPFLLPPTVCIGGRDSRPRSHYFYVCPDGPAGGRGTQRFASPSGGVGTGTPPRTYAELRWAGSYTLLPPSFHPEGELYAWEGQPADDPLPPPPVPWDSLDRSVREVAGAALLLEVYPEWTRLGCRHYATLALAGCLLSSGWDASRCERFLYALARAGGDEEADARVDNARSTADRLARGEPMAGWPALVSYAESGRVDRLKRFLGINGGGDVWSRVMSGQTGQGGGAGATPPPPAQPQQAPAAPTSPVQGPSVAAPAPVISTAAQAAQSAAQATTQAQNQTPSISPQEVAMFTAEAVADAQPVAKDEGGALYCYHDGVYLIDPGEHLLRQLIRDEVVLTHGASFHSKRMADEVLYNIGLRAPLMGRPDPVYLHVRNGRLNVLTGDLEPHHHRHLTTIKLPITYDPQATCPHIDRFFVQVFPADAVTEDVPAQIVAMCACPLRGIELSILLVGEGANGKSVTLKLIRRFVGDDNIATLTLQDISGDRFGTSDLRGKLLDVCYDLPTRRIEDSGAFKAIVSGEPIRSQRKNERSFVFEPYCRLLFSANSLPESEDVSHGYMRRWYITPFMQTFEPGSAGHRPEGELLAELTTEQELSGLLNKALVQMRRFLAGGAPTTSATMREEVEEFKAVVDPFPMWLRAQLESSPQGWVETAAVVTKYKERAERRGRTVPLNPRAAGRVIHELFPGTVPEKRRLGGTGTGIGQSQGQTTALGKQVRGWRGVSWRLGQQP